MTVVADLPRRVAHATHALVEMSRERGMPVTAGEAVLYDEEALDARATGRALQRARDRGLAVNAGRYWVPTNLALELRTDLEDRYLTDTQRPGDQ